VVANLKRREGRSESKDASNKERRRIDGAERQANEGGSRGEMVREYLVERRNDAKRGEGLLRRDGEFRGYN
jgi:uncharacterized protein with NRDE domain